MKIFSMIKNYFKNIKTKKKLKVFKKYLSKLEEAFLNLQLIEEPFDYIRKHYNEIKLNDNNLIYINKFDELTSKIGSHNQLIDKINLFVESFSFNESITKINVMSQEEIDELLKTVEFINGFQKYRKKHQVFINEVLELTNNKEDILRQFQIHQETMEFYNYKMSMNSYIDGKEALNIKETINKALDELKKYSKQYFKISQHKNLNENIETHNKNYITNNINNKLFDNINGRSLGIDQRKAILTDAVSNLVIAGAGSGKTLTICGKAKWLLEDQRIHKDDIVFLSYSKASADDLKEKLSMIDDDLNVSTFHSLGLRILESESKIKQNVETNYDAIIERFFSTEIFKSENKVLLRKVLDFYAKFTYTLPEEKYETKGELYEKLKELDFKTLKESLTELSNDQQEKETILKEKVKSFEEMAIANYYFLNGIKYRYEKPYPFKTSSSQYRQYNPDFTLTDYDIYHEHYGIDRNGRCLQYSKEEESSYLAGMRWKEALHLEKNTKHLKSYSYEFREETIFDKLEEKLTSLGVVIKPISEEEVENALKSIYQNKNFKSFITLIKSFINLYKSRYPNNTFFETLKLEKFDNAYEKQRANLFLDITKEVYDYYKDQLGEKVDFDDMILEAIRIIPTKNEFKYKYIVVDEFQDISYSRMELLRSLIKPGNSKLFAVGDDWQSIYRFAGSDLAIFTKFENYFAHTKRSRLDYNFRNSKELHEIIEPFITRNPEQIKKDITCNNELTRPVKIIYHNSNKISALNEALLKIEKINPNAKVLLLGRNNFDIDDYLTTKTPKNYAGKIKLNNFPNMDISFKTIHRSKGLEEEFVIVINNENSRVGLPNKIEDDPLLSLVLSDKSKFLYSEERRLFYVALTRTKTYCYLLTDANKESEFIEEIKDRCEIINAQLINNDDKIYCPECKSGHLVIRGERNNQFYGCTNYPYCRYSQREKNLEGTRRCPNCNHFIVWRKGTRGYFLGCTNYPRCRQIISPKYYDIEKWKPKYK